MASLALGVVGAVIGSYFGQPQLGFLIGSYLGGYLEEGPHSEGPRLNDRAVQASTYGIPIPIVRGTARVAGNIIWAADLREVPVDEGGKGGPSASATIYTYYGTFAVSLCANQISAVRKIWADGNLIYDGSDGNSGPVGISASEAFYQNININDVALPLVVYLGSDTQLPDPTMEAYKGAGNVPAYRGQAYIVFTDLPLERFGNRIPNLSFEVLEVGTVADQVTVYSSPARLRPHAVYNPLLNEVWQELDQTSTADPFLVRLNADTGDVVGYIYGSDLHSSNATFINFDGNPVYDPLTGSIILASDNRTYVRIDAATGAQITAANPGGAWPIGLSGPYINPVTGDVWFATSGTHALYRINKFTGAVTDSVAFSYNFIDMVFDDLKGSGWLLLYAADGGGVQSQLWKLDEFGVAVTSAYTHTSTLDLITYDSLRKVLLITTGGSGTVLEFDAIVEAPLATTFTLAHTPTAISYDPQRDLLNAINWSTERYFPSFVSTGATYKDIPSTDQMGTIMSGKNAILGTGGATSGLSDWDMVKIRFDVVTGGSVLLSDIVEDICVRAGLETTDVDVSQLTDIVLGYVITRQSAARACVEQLATGFLFDGVESDDVVKFVKRGGATAASIPADDLAAREPSGSVPDIITKTRAQDVELPTKLNVIYAARSLDYQQSTQMAERLAGAAPDSAQIMSIEAPIVMSDDYARQLADALMFNAWTERTRYAFATGVKYASYEPTDVLTVNGNTLRVKTKNESGGLIKFEAVAEDSDIYEQLIEGVAAEFAAQTVDALVISFFTPMDTVLLRDADDAAGFYAAAGGYQTGWNGEVLYQSSDGITYTQLRALTTASRQGVATVALGDFHGGNIFDELNVLTVALRAGATLSSSTNADVRNGANAAAVKSGDDWEIIQFRDVTLNANGTYSLRGLLRGRKGSEFAMAGHVAGDAFVLMSDSTTANFTIDSSAIGQERFYKPVSIGDSLGATLAQSVTIDAVRLKPLSPAHLGGGRNAAGDIIGTWKRRGRLGAGWRDGVDVALGEDSELYDAVIYTDGTYTTVARTFADLSVQTFTYTAAQQTTDFGSQQSRVYVQVFQKSATVGRGFPGRVTI